MTQNIDKNLDGLRQIQENKLLQQLLYSNLPKTDIEWAAVEEIERLQTSLKEVSLENTELKRRLTSNLINNEPYAWCLLQIEGAHDNLLTFEPEGRPAIPLYTELRPSTSTNKLLPNGAVIQEDCYAAYYAGYKEALYFLNSFGFTKIKLGFSYLKTVISRLVSILKISGNVWQRLVKILPKELLYYAAISVVADITPTVTKEIITILSSYRNKYLR